MIDCTDLTISISKQCEMVNVSSSSYYAYKEEHTDTDEEVKSMINTIYAARPEYGSRRITEILKRSGTFINRKRTQRSHERYWYSRGPPQTKFKYRKSCA